MFCYVQTVARRRPVSAITPGKAITEEPLTGMGSRLLWLKYGDAQLMG